MGEHRRLLDEFHWELQAQGIAAPGKIEICVTFGDLMWPPCGEAGGMRDMLERAKADPAFTITAYTRYVALARVVDEIRFFAAPIAAGAPSWWWNGQAPDRVAAVKAEPDIHEMAILKRVTDAVRFTQRYLAGTSLDAIDVVRIRPTAARYKPT
jgi:hypothetical protein